MYEHNAFQWTLSGRSSRAPTQQDSLPSSPLYQALITMQWHIWKGALILLSICTTLSILRRMIVGEINKHTFQSLQKLCSEHSSDSRSKCRHSSPPTPSKALCSRLSLSSKGTVARSVFLPPCGFLTAFKFWPLWLNFLSSLWWRLSNLKKKKENMHKSNLFSFIVFLLHWYFSNLEYLKFP